MYTEERYFLLLKSIVVFGVFLALSIIITTILGDAIVENSGVVRAGGIFSNLNSAGFSCYMSIVFTLLLYLETKDKKLLFFMLILLMAMLITGSRASMLCLFVTVSFFVLKRNVNKYLLLTIALSFFLTLFSIPFFYKKIIVLLRLDRGLSGRNVLYDIGLSIINENKLTGIGLGNLKLVGSEKLMAINDIGAWEKEQLLSHAIQSSHNAYIETTVELGILGLIVLLLLLFILLIKYFKLIKHALPKNKNIFILFLAATFSCIVRGFFESNGILNKGWISIDIFFWLLYICSLRKKQLKIL